MVPKPRGWGGRTWQRWGDVQAVARHGRVPQPQPDLIVVLDGGPVLLAELILAIHGIGVLPVDPPTPPRAKQLVPAEVPRKCQACGV